MGLFKKKVTMTTLNIKEKLRPEHRYSYYEKLLEEVLKKAKIGKVVGGGTMLLQGGEMMDCDVEIDCYKGKEDELLSLLQNLPLAKGSKLIVHSGDGDGDDSKEYPLGNLEGIGIYINGTDLPKEVYTSCDINVVAEELTKLLDEHMVLYSYWEGGKETGFFFYGESFEEMKKLVAPFLESYPLCQKSRVIQIA